MNNTFNTNSLQEDRYKTRKSNRLKGYDYTMPGAYFVTICTDHMLNLFGKIVDESMNLNIYGEIARAEWFKTTIIRHYVRLFDDEFVIMPNHIHGIVWILDVGATRRVAYSNNPKCLKPGSLGAIICQYKSITSKRINKIRKISGRRVWQRNYFDHIIRTNNELDAIRKYIQTNPQDWDSDQDISTHHIDYV